MIQVSYASAVANYNGFNFTYAFHASTQTFSVNCWLTNVNMMPVKFQLQRKGSSWWITNATYRDERVSLQSDYKPVIQSILDWHTPEYANRKRRKK